MNWNMHLKWYEMIWTDFMTGWYQMNYEMIVWNDSTKWLYDMIVWNAFIYRELANSVQIMWKLEVIEPKRTSLFMVLVDTICTDFCKK